MTDESSHEPKEHLRLQRRSTVICCLIIILYYAGNMHFSKISVLGNQMDIGTEKIPPLFFIYLLYTSGRYLQTSLNNKVFTGFANLLKTITIMRADKCDMSVVRVQNLDTTPMLKKYLIVYGDKGWLRPQTIAEYSNNRNERFKYKDLHGRAYNKIRNRYYRVFIRETIVYIFTGVFFFEKLFPFILIIGAGFELIGCHWTGWVLSIASYITVEPPIKAFELIEDPYSAFEI